MWQILVRTDASTGTQLSHTAYLLAETQSPTEDRRFSIWSSNLLHKELFALHISFPQYSNLKTPHKDNPFPNTISSQQYRDGRHAGTDVISIERASTSSISNYLNKIDLSITSDTLWNDRDHRRLLGDGEAATYGQYHSTILLATCRDCRLKSYCSFASNLNSTWKLLSFSILQRRAGLDGT